MSKILAQMILGARDGGIEGWMDILVLVFLAVVYGLGSILKARKNKEKEDAKRLSPQKPAQKPAKKGLGLIEQIVSEIQRVAQPEQSQKQKPAVQPAPKTQAAVRKYAAEAKQATQTKSAIPPSKPKSSMRSSQVQPTFEELPELGTNIQSLPKFTGKSVKGLAGKGKRIAYKTSDSKYLSDILIDYADPEDLRRAILHYEILGRPLALRESHGRIIGL